MYSQLSYSVAGSQHPHRCSHTASGRVLVFERVCDREEVGVEGGDLNGSGVDLTFAEFIKT